MFPILCCSGPSAADDGDLTMDEDFVPPDREPLRSERRSELVEARGTVRPVGSGAVDVRPRGRTDMWRWKICWYFIWMSTCFL